MPMKDLSGKTVYDLEPEDFLTLFCKACREYGNCLSIEIQVLTCKALVDSGLWDRFYRRR